ncbi:MAG: NADH-quinone oxidoreductase subunit J [Thermoplasmata archaeon]|jgi:NADH-ubiquinone/plastoquinone oxidoreductase chain 6.|nr:NADH-quinone oxidoreductase subunit J [Thermoplasmata archaeon]MVT13330.1 short chain dehydrogenase [Euryarchaeota archaeon]MVT14382.1 short chain dehydrogenase [Euryarchaeota archaeon]MVT35328.1 short chain dehydrogenase [Euryarchaeota archaeon]
MIETVFLIVGIIGIVFGIWAVSDKNLLRAAFALTFFLLSIATLYVILNAQFLAMVQILVYVGAVIILILFTIMLTRGEEVED